MFCCVILCRCCISLCCGVQFVILRHLSWFGLCVVVMVLCFDGRCLVMCCVALRCVALKCVVVVLVCVVLCCVVVVMC